VGQLSINERGLEVLEGHCEGLVEGAHVAAAEGCYAAFRVDAARQSA
jgi:hypothetical protein